MRKDLPVNNFKEFVAYTEATRSKMQFGSAGTGSATHLGCVLLDYVIEVTLITHVPYRGTGPAMRICKADVSTTCATSSPRPRPQIDGGTVKALD